MRALPSYPAWLVVLCLGALPALGATWYVATNGSDVAEGTNWATAKQTIQAAIDLAVSNDVVLVSNGVYATGGRVVFCDILTTRLLTNRVAITNAITVQSVNGPAATTIQGARDPLTTNGNAAVRCVYVGSNAFLSGFTLTNGATRTSGDDGSGGGAWCARSGVISNCILAGNSAQSCGGAAYGTLNNCLVSGNRATTNSGGTGGGVLNNCVVSGNTAGMSGGGATWGALNNCAVTSNSASQYGGGTYACTQTNCMLTGNSAGRDGGGAWGSTLNNCTLSGNVAGWSGGGAADSTLINCVLTSNRANNGGGGSYRSTNSYCTFSTNAASSGGGAYEGALFFCALSGNTAINGGGSCLGTLTECTFTDNRAQNRGGGSFQNTLSNCTLSGNSAFEGGASFESTLVGCTLSGNSATNCGGGSHSGTLSNCVLSGNSAPTNYGGGAFASTLNHCALAGNAAYEGGGAASGTLYHCTLTGNQATFGGGCAEGLLTWCVLTSNSAVGGGGAFRGNLINCLLSANTATIHGGGAYKTELTNCTVAGNAAGTGSGGVHCGLHENGRIWNCIVYSNLAPVNPNWYDAQMYYTCTTPLPTDPWSTGNIADEPRFMNAAAGNYHLRSDSPCINRGYNAFGAGSVDLDGKPRIIGGTIDMGAYEYQGYWGWASAITNGLTNYNDCATGDGYPNLLKYVTGGSATNPDELARLSGFISNDTGVLVFRRDTSVDDATLVVQGAASISNGSAWEGLATNINGSWGGMTNVIEIGAGNPIVCHVQDPAPSRTNRFLRLAVTRP